MAPSDHETYGQPMSVKDLTEKAKEYNWNPRIGFKYWARAAETIHHEGQVYLHEGNIAQAYLFFLRYSFLVLDNLDKHPQAQEPEARKAVKPLKKRIPAVIEKLEELRPQVKASHDEWLKITAAQRDQVRDGFGSVSSTYSRHAARDPALSWNHVSPAKILDASEHQELAVEMANSRRRRLAGLSEEEERRRRGAGFWAGWNQQVDTGQSGAKYMTDDELRRQMEATRRQLDYSVDSSRTNERDSDAVPSTSYYYPSINKSSSVRYDGLPPTPKPLPVRPPKESVNRIPPSVDQPPTLPRKEPLKPSPIEETRSTLQPPPTLPPKVKEDTKEKRVTFRPAAYLENGEPLRPVFLPHQLRKRFLMAASDNTRRNLEMCGILCGELVNNALFVSHLVIPRQKCSPDTCETEDEASLLEYCINNGLSVIGWIHTHPTQTCFMSSRDLHTQAGYQVMMPESIAIVCAPRHEPSWGIFRLTHPPGLNHVLQCEHNDTFHQHSIDNLYVEIGQQPATHVYESSSLDFSVTDLRDNV
ncbi:hypothetical protein V8F20_010638 [Naviculisporaceae sp. PSN 640]